MIISYGESTLSVAVAASSHVFTFSFDPGATIAALYLNQPYSEWQPFKWIYYCVSLVVFCGLLTRLLSRRNQPLLRGFVAVTLFTMTLECTLAVSAERHFQTANWLVSLVIGSCFLYVMELMATNQFASVDDEPPDRTSPAVDAIRRGAIG